MGRGFWGWGKMGRGVWGWRDEEGGAGGVEGWWGGGVGMHYVEAFGDGRVASGYLGCWSKRERTRESRQLGWAPFL